ncbi:MAG: hypothetical protein ACMXYL_04520 [Candidatus Woesearchaeota archaeon]
MGTLKDIALAIAIGYSALATYSIMQSENPDSNTQTTVQEQQTQSRGQEIAEFYHGGLSYPVYEGPIGPRLGSIEYIAENLSHDERILMTEQILQYLPNMASRTVTDIWDNRQTIASDIARKVEWLIRGGE